jgi:eukaryotic-like serine/threonine-protein kinase
VAPPDERDPLVGALVGGRYRVRALLGEGGMGQVYLAVHEAIEKKVALKVLRPQLSNKRDIVTRFQQEAISASRIKHPNVLDVFDFGQLDDGCCFLAMELLEGHDLSVELAQGQPLTPIRAVAIALQVARALGAAHAAGVVHRDLKPENVFLQRRPDASEEVKLVDFGIAQLRAADGAALSEPRRRRLTRTGMIFGTPEYMAPEQAAGLNADRRVDIYSLGILLYEMLTGSVPFTGDTFLGVCAAQINQPLPPLQSLLPSLVVSPMLQGVIERMLAKRPDDRFQSIQEVLSDLGATPEARGVGRSADTVLAGTAIAPVRSPHTLVYRSPLPPPRGDADTLPAAAAVKVATTPLAAEAAPGRPPKSRTTLLVSAGAVMALLAAVLVAVPRLQPKAHPAASPASTEAPATSRPAKPGPSASPAATSSAAPIVAPTGAIRLAVETEPPGAVLFKDGAQVCDATPCEVLAKPEETLELVARKGPAQGRTKVIAQRDQRVTIRLSTPASGPKPAPQERLCERYSEDLGIKITVKCPD